jgi:hypothetical protein
MQKNPNASILELPESCTHPSCGIPSFIGNFLNQRGFQDKIRAPGRSYFWNRFDLADPN